MLEDMVKMFKKGWLGALGIVLALAAIVIFALTFPILLMILIVSGMFIALAVIMGAILS